MDDRRSSTPPTPPAPDGSPVPARLRIVAWIMLTTGLGLLAVVLTIRSVLLTEVEQAANTDVRQEIDEFRTFAANGRDPETGAPFTDPTRLLALYLERQFPGEAEVLVGVDRAAAEAGASPLIVQAAPDRFGLHSDPALVLSLVDAPESSGIAVTASGAEFRWGSAAIDTAAGPTGGAFLVAEFLGPGRAAELDDVGVIVLVCLGGLVFTAVIAFVVAGQILGPVRAVRRAAGQITRADLGRRIEVRGRDDVAALAVTFNAMLDRLEQSFSAHQNFSSTAGRHLRAPLATLADDTSSRQDRAAALRRITTILDDLDVLAVSHLPGFVRPEPVDAGVLTDLLAAEAGAPAGEPWTVEEKAAGTAHLDARRIHQAVGCLARNALGQTTGPGTPRLGTRIDGDAFEVWIADDGPGLTPERAARVLDRYQDRGADDLGTDGPGLGLAVVRAVADAHEGSAWVETAPGRGARFGLRLPLVTS